MFPYGQFTLVSIDPPTESLWLSASSSAGWTCKKLVSVSYEKLLLDLSCSYMTHAIERLIP